MGQRKALTLYLLNHYRQNLLLPLFVLWQEYKSGAVLAFLRHRNALKQYELMRNLQQYAGAVASLTVCSLCTAMAEVLKNLQRVVD